MFIVSFTKVRPAYSPAVNLDHIKIYKYKERKISLSRVVCGVDLRLLGCCDRGFESRCGYGYSSAMFIKSCAGSGFCDELITWSEESYRVCVCVCVCVCMFVCVCVCIPLGVV
jgi:hypothetical protein